MIYGIYWLKKIGMSRTISVPSFPVTLLQVIDTKICEVRPDGKALVAFSQSKKMNKAIEGQQKKYSLPKEFNKFMTIEVGAEAKSGDYSSEPLKSASLVKTSLKSKGRGFQGGMKRHNFSGGPSSHGHRFGRRIGSIGMCEWPR